MRVAVVTVYNPANGRSMTANALFDEASEVTLMDRALATKLDIRGRGAQYGVTGAGNSTTTFYSENVEFKIGKLGTNPKQHAQMHTLTAQTIPKLCGNFAPIDWSVCKVHWEHLHHLPIPAPTKNGIRLLIGNKQAHLMSS